MTGGFADRNTDALITLIDDMTPEEDTHEKGVTKEDCIKGGVFHHGDCTPKKAYRWRSNGACKTWVTRPDEFRLPIKFGLRSYDYITERNASMFHRAEDCPHGHG